MATNVLYGPDGQPLIHSIAPAGPDAVIAKANELNAGAVIEKKVRSQGTSLATVWDSHRGKPKPTPVSWDTLRMMSVRNEWLRAIVKTRKNQIGKAKWSIVPKDKDDKTPSTKRLCESMTQLLRRPSLHGSRPNSRGWRQFIAEVLEDILVLDAGCIEKERDGHGWIIAMYPVDGATIRPNLDDRGGFQDDAYVQMIDGQVTARFGVEDLVYVMDNPMTDVRFAGYGFSPVENLLLSVTAELFASKFNASYFEKGSVPEGLLDLGEDVTPEDVDAFRLYWQNEIMGKAWALPIIGGSKAPGFTPWRQPNRDMQFMEYQEWLLKKMCAVMQIAPQEVGQLEDVNRSTAESQEGSNESKSIEPVLSLIADYIEVEIVGPHGQGVGDLVEFKWDEEGDDEQTINARFTAMVPVGAATRLEWRNALNMDLPDEAPDGLGEFLVDGTQPVPLPDKQDLDTMGAKAQQDREDDQAQQQQLGPQSSMPWKPGNAEDPHMQGAIAQHGQQASAGAGPINPPGPGGPIGKTADPPAPDGLWHHSSWETKPPHKVSGAPIHLGSEDAAKHRVFMRTRLHPDRNPTLHHYTLSEGTRIAHQQRPVRERTAITHPEFEEKLKAKGYHGYAYRNDVEDAGSTSLKLFDRSRLVHQGSDEYRVNKTAEIDSNPALSGRQDGLDAIFAEKHTELVQGLSEILHVPVALLDQAI